MAQQSHHVPKFGNWDDNDDNVPYTAYFDNARKEKGTGAKKFNPNDPEENPDAFIFGTVGCDSEDNDHHHVRQPPVPHHVGPPPSRETSDRKMRVVASYEEESAEHSKGEEAVTYRNTTHQAANVGRRKSIHSESSSDKSSSDFSLLRQKRRSNRKKNLGEGSNNFTPLSPSRMRNGIHRVDEPSHHKSASVPKFGAWNEMDPKSGEGFTVIFNKVKEEKQIGATKFPPIPPEPTKHPKAAKSSKICCCMF